jgi:putative FmdB family regulatory protein
MYEFRCLDCGERFEELLSIHDSDLGVDCPSCGKSRVEKLFSSFATSAGGGAASSGSAGSGGGSCGPRGFS